MKIMKCEMCGGTDLIKAGGVYVCSNCNTKYSIDEAKKLMVTIDQTESVQKWHTLARRARFEGNAQEASRYYTLIKEQNPDDWEASFFSTYYQVSDCKLAQIPNASEILCPAILSASILITKQAFLEASEEGKAKFEVNAYTEMYSACKDFAQSAALSAMKHKNEFANTGAETSSAASARTWIRAGLNVLHTVTHLIGVSKNVKADPNYKTILKNELDYLNQYRWALSENEYTSKLNEITVAMKAVDPSFAEPVNQKKKDSNKSIGAALAMILIPLILVILFWSWIMANSH